jgi:sec-independent protein translocase protein TatC
MQGRQVEQERKMTFFDHLGELRKRLIRIALVVAVAFGISIYFTPRILGFLLQPYGSQLKVIGPTEGVANYLRIALVCGAAASLPYALWEIWRFIAPALMPRERRYVSVMIPFALLLFAVGAAFAWFLLIPAAIRFLANFSPDIFKTEWTSQNYIPFVTSLLFWIGVCFELPLAAFFLAKLRVVNARLLLRGWRYATVLICIVAAIITPTVDPFNLMLVAVPLVALYFASILLAALAQRGGAPKPRESGAA